MIFGMDVRHCLCGMHVHSAARIIAIKSIMLAVFKFCFLLFQLLYLDNKEKKEHGPFVKAYNFLVRHYEKDHITTIELAICLVLALVSLFLFYGNRQHKAKFYVPYIIYSALEALQAIVNICIFVYSTYMAGYGEIDEALKPIRQQIFTYCIVLTSIFTILYILRTYFFLIVISQAFVFLLNSQKEGNLSRLTVPTNMSSAPENKMLSEFPSSQRA